MVQEQEETEQKDALAPIRFPHNQGSVGWHRPTADPAAPLMDQSGLPHARPRLILHLQNGEGLQQPHADAAQGSHHPWSVQEAGGVASELLIMI